MMNKLTFMLCFMIFSLGLQAQDSKTHQVTDLETKALSMIEGNLETGTTMPLKWAESSQVACFPGTRFHEFKGNHVLYRVPLPANSYIKITVEPKNKKDRINLYALRLGADNMALPPDVLRASTCEASYPRYAGKPNYNKANQPQSVEIISIRNPYNILIGVAGAEGILEGDYELKIEIGER